jgi:hypothetical protein
MLPSINNPSTNRNKQNNSKRSNAVIHVSGGDGQLGWEYE